MEEALARMEDSAEPPPEGARAGGRAEIDTSAPFESVQVPVDRFGGSAVWKSQLSQLFAPKDEQFEEVEVLQVEEQTTQLEEDLASKERETFDVLKELEKTKKIIANLELKIQKESSEAASTPVADSDAAKIHPIPESEKQGPEDHEIHVYIESPDLGKNRSPVLTLELKQTKLDLNRKPNELAEICAATCLLKSTIDEEKISLEKSQEKLTSNSVMISILEDDLNKMAQTLQVFKDADGRKCKDPSDISREIKRMNSMIEQIREVTNAAKSEVIRLTSEIEQTRSSIKTAGVGCIAAKMMEEAARVAEAVALNEIKALMSTDTSTTVVSVEEYIVLTQLAREADEESRRKIEAATLQVNEANRSKSVLLRNLDEVKEEAKASKGALEEALKRLEIANRAKLAVEESLHRWRLEHGQKKRSVQNSAKFKCYAAHHHRDSRMVDLNGINLVCEEDTKGSLKPAMSIGHILSMKLSTLEKRIDRPNVSLGQMLNMSLDTLSAEVESAPKKHARKRKKFSFVVLSVLLAKEHKNKKMQSWSSR